MVLYIVRHGQSERNVNLSGPYDCPLTELGERQAQLTGEWLEGRGIEFLYCSPTIRALQTAEIVGTALALTPKTWADIVEWGYLFDEPGLTARAMRDAFPDVEVDPSLPDDRGWAEGTTNESWAELYQRAGRIKQELLQRHPVGSPPVAMITHEHFARYLVGVLLGLASPDHWQGKIRHHNCGITCIEFQEDHTVLQFANAHFHLESLAH